MAEQAMQQRQARSAEPSATAPGLARTPLAQLAAQLDASAPVQRMQPLKKKLAQKAIKKKPLQRAARGGLPDQVKSGVEALSGMSMDHVRVHYGSARPAQLNAHAYTQGADIHVAPGQERHVPHEAWHVVQQAQGRVKPTMQMAGGVPVNDDAGLEHEADRMGARALQMAGRRKLDEKA